MCDFTQTIKIVSWVLTKLKHVGGFMFIKQFFEALYETQFILSNKEVFSLRVAELSWLKVPVRGNSPDSRLGSFHPSDMTRASRNRCASVVHKIKMTMKHGQPKLAFHSLLGEEFLKDILHQFIAVQLGKSGTCSLEGREGLKMPDRIFANRHGGK
jgi:hypothetical protein